MRLFLFAPLRETGSLSGDFDRRAARLLNPAIEFARVIDREPHASVRSRPSEAALIAAMYRKPPVEKDRERHGRLIIFVREMVGVHPLDDEASGRGFETGAPARDFPDDRLFASFRDGHTLAVEIDADLDLRLGHAREGDKKDGGGE